MNELVQTDAIGSLYRVDMVITNITKSFHKSRLYKQIKSYKNNNGDECDLV